MHRKSVLSDRIEAGLADPISEEEREIVARLRSFYEKKFGKSENRLRVTEVVLKERERELLELKGPCSSKGCALHYAHYGPCDIK